MRRFFIAVALLTSCTLWVGTTIAEGPTCPTAPVIAPLEVAATVAPLLETAGEPLFLAATGEDLSPLPAAICGGLNQGCCPGNACAGELICMSGKCRGNC